MPRLSAPVAVLASAALLASVAGGSYAAGTLITSQQIKDGTIKVKDLNKLTVTALKGQTGPAGPAGAKGATGSKGDAGPAGPAGPAGKDAWQTPASGVALTGLWYADSQSTGVGSDTGAALSLPSRAGAELNWGTNVFFSPASTTGPGVPPSFISASCSGTPAAPTAPAGVMCVYSNTAANANLAVTNVGSLADRHLGVLVRVVATGASGDFYAYGTWAYTAP